MRLAILSVELILVKGSANNHIYQGASWVSHQARVTSASSASADTPEKTFRVGFSIKGCPINVSGNVYWSGITLKDQNDQQPDSIKDSNCSQGKQDEIDPAHSGCGWI
jgi:hypothetical protein